MALTLRGGVSRSASDTMDSPMCPLETYCRGAISENERTQELQTGRARSFPRNSRVELLEERVLLAVGVPSVVEPGEAQLTLFAPDVTQFWIPENTFPTTRQLFQFSGDADTATYPARFTLAPDHPCAKSTGGNGGPCANLDVAIGVYDRSGNLIASADAADGTPAIEELPIELQRQTPYLVGVFFDQAGPARDFHFMVSMGEQSSQEPIHTNPATGTASLVAEGGEQLFNSPYDVDYYPLQLLNIGPSASVDIDPLGLDVAAAMRVFRFDPSIEMWVPAHDGTMPGTIGDEGTATIESPPGANTNDVRYLLAAAPANFSTAAGAYQIDIATSEPLLGPASVPSAANPTELLTLPPAALGTAQCKSPAISRRLRDGTIVSGHHPK